MYALKVFFACIIPVIFIASFLFAWGRKVKVYDCFTQGIKGAIPLIISLFPYVAAVTMLAKILEVSGIRDMLSSWLAPAFSFLGVPESIAPLVLIKPLSGSGAIAVLTEILDAEGIDSYAGRCACVLYGSSETIFYIGAVYFAGVKRKKLNAAMVIALVSFLASVLFGCFLCNFM